MKLTYRSECRICGCKQLSKLIRFDPIAQPMRFEKTPEAARAVATAPISLSICESCGHWQSLEVVDDESLWVGYTYQSGHAGVMPKHFKESAEKIIAKYKPAPGSLVIDIGSNDGSFLRPFKDAGYRVLGVEMVKEIAKQATANGIETIGEPLSPKLAEEIRAKYGPAAIVTAFNVMAHSDDLLGMARAVQLLMGPESVFVFEVQYLVDVVEKTLIATVFHEHLSHHSVKSMSDFLGRFYMRIIDVDRVPIQHGSIIGYAQFVSGPRPVNPYVNFLMDHEKKVGLDKPETLRRFGIQVATLRQKCEALAAQWKAEGAQVAGYGAAMSGPGLISMLGLKGAIQYLLDDHEQKVYHYSPGDALQIAPTVDLYRRMPQYCVILAWVHADKIIAENQRYLEQGGKFVVLCPNFRIVSAEAKEACAA